MTSRENIKYTFFIILTSIVTYKLIDNPLNFFDCIFGACVFFSPFLIGILISLLINPLMKLFEIRLKFPRLLSLFVSYVLFFLCICLSFNLLIPSLVSTLNSIISDIDIYTKTLNLFLNDYLSNIGYINTILPSIQESLNTLLTYSVDYLDSLYTDLPNYIFNISSALINIVIGLVLSIYMLLDKDKIKTYCKDFLYAFNTKSRADKIIGFFRTSHDIFYSYMMGQILLTIIVSILCFVGLKFLIKVENSLFLSFIIGISNLIPFFGPFIGGIFVILIILVYSPMKAFYAAIFLFVIQQIDANFIGPKIMGDYVGLSPLIVISCVLIGGELFSFLGVFLSVPIAAIINIYLRKIIKNRLNHKQSY